MCRRILVVSRLRKKQPEIRTIPPDTTEQRNTILVGCTGGARPSRTGGTTASIKPAIGPPFQSVGKRMMIIGGRGEAIEHHNWGAIRLVVSITIRDEDQLRRGHQPDAATANCDAGQHLHVVGKDRPFVEPAIVIRVFQNQHAITQAQVKFEIAIGVSVVLGNPQPAARIPGHGNRILDIRFCGKHIHLEAVGNSKPLCSILRRKCSAGDIRFRIDGVRKRHRFGGNGIDGIRPHQRCCQKQRKGKDGVSHAMKTIRRLRFRESV